ncbi:MAG: nitroreductase family protein [Bryobacteraceae bacterium]|nr:nitroreductase family protein [Bryobacteraceae bacterium]
MSTIDWKQKARSMIHRAVLAPSSHNTQPWLFRVSDSTIDLWADRTRALPVNDPEDRELAISCGCALMNLRVAAAAEGFAMQVELLPAVAEPDWLARASFGGMVGAAAEEASLAASIESRRTYRKRFEPRAVDSEALHELLQAASQEGVSLRPLHTDEARQEAARLVAEGDAAQWANMSWRRELAAWMHPRRRGDGLSMPALAVPVAQLVVRTFDMGGGVGAKDRELAEASPVLAVLCTDGDRAPDWLMAGQALEHVLLAACRSGLQASYLNQPVQTASLRPRLQDLAGGGFPQVLLRLGYPTEAIAATPRRPIEEIVDWVV